MPWQWLLGSWLCKLELNETTFMEGIAIQRISWRGVDEIAGCHGPNLILSEIQVSDVRTAA
jgi:hypothetical protein